MNKKTATKSEKTLAQSEKEPSEKVPVWAWIVGAILVVSAICLFGWLEGEAEFNRQLSALKESSPSGQYMVVFWQPYYGSGPYNDNDPIKTGGAMVIDGSFKFPLMVEGMQFTVLSSNCKKFQNGEQGRSILSADALGTWNSGRIPWEIQYQGVKVRYVTYVGHTFFGALHLYDGYSVLSDDGAYRTYGLGSNCRVDLGKDKLIKDPNGEEFFYWK